MASQSRAADRFVVALMCRIDLERTPACSLEHMDAAPEPLTPAQMAQRSGVSIDTLRYYEREGLLNAVARAGSGHRRYSADDAAWVEVLRCLRDTGMSIEQLRRYCELGAQGTHTQPERLRMLRTHRALVEDQIAARYQALRLIDHKISVYPQGVHDDQ
ncbi:MAG: MerR family transcriptional regulator [Ornithinimicrobium sp.]